MAYFASEKHAIANCDRCGFQFPLKELKWLTIRMKKINWRVCPSCWEKDHPQYKLGTFKIYDPQALQNPRPDVSMAASRGFFGWNPVYAPAISPVIGVARAS